MQGIGAAASGKKRGRQDHSRDDEDGDVRVTAETMNERDRGGNDGDDAPKTPKKTKRGTKGSRKTSDQRAAVKRAGMRAGD